MASYYADLVDGGDVPTPVIRQSAKLTEPDAPAPVVDTTPRNTAPVIEPVAETVRPTYAQLTPAQRAAMTPAEQLAYIHGDTLAKAAAAQTAYASQGPLFDKSNVPPLDPTLAKQGYYYQWVGGSSSGKWTLTNPPVTGGGNTGGGGGGGGNPVVTGTGSTGNGTTTPTVTPGGSINANPGALQIITDALSAAGLGSLATKAWSMWNQGYDMNAIMDDPTNGIRASAVYKQNFPAMAALNAKGQGISEAAYLAKENADLELMKQYGIPSGIFDTKDYLGSLMTNNVTTQDLQSRLQAVSDTVNSYDPSVKKYALDTYGLDSGHLAAWALDPTKALPVIQQQAKAVQIGGAALMTKFAGGLGPNGELSTAQAEALAGAGVTQAQAQTGFNNIAQQGQLAQALPGDVSGNVTNQQLINAQFGMNANDTMALKKVQQGRINEFNAGGAVVGNANGLAGLGTSNATA